MLKRYRNWKLLLLIVDVAALFAAFHLAYWLRLGFVAADLLIPNSYLYLVATVVLFYFLDLYNPWSQYSDIQFQYRAVAGVLLAGALSSLIAYVVNDYSETVHFGRGVMVISYLVFLGPAFLSRLLVASRLNPARENVRLLVLASPDMARRFEDELQRRSEKWQRCYLLDRPAEKHARELKKDGVLAYSDGIANLKGLLKQDWTIVVVATDRLTQEQTAMLLDARLAGLRLFDLGDFYEHFFFKLPIFYLKDSWFLVSRGFLILEKNAGRRLKVWADRFLAILFLIPALPFLVIAGIAIVLESGRPIFFSQERTGENGKSFMVLKLRTMIKDAEKDGARWASKNDSRITRLGRVLRVTRLDELPQLINILRGDMSFIGPRPERPVFNEMLEKEIPFYNLRHVVRPGLTGWAQVMYPYGASVEDSAQKLEYDLYYIKNFSFLLDFLILLKTVKVVLFRRGR